MVWGRRVGQLVWAREGWLTVGRMAGVGGRRGVGVPEREAGVEAGMGGGSWWT